MHLLVTTAILQINLTDIRIHFIMYFVLYCKKFSLCIVLGCNALVSLFSSISMLPSLSFSLKRGIAICYTVIRMR
uniref:Uncharacterized protein n=1 Tax=Papilio xuthus TaxID=66420 RepID=I4DLP6_PAPXU|nr:unknown unsecreted protein [Papilio xuthus]